MAIKWLLLTVLVSVVSGAEAQTVTAASCNASDVQVALNSTTSSTTTVNIPAGTCEWTSQIYFTVPAGSNTFSIVGAGNLTSTGGGDATVIVDNDTAVTNSLLTITTAAASSFFRFAGITLQAGTGTAKYNGIVNIEGNSQNVRIDHDHFQLTTGVGFDGDGLRFDGWNYGVVDHSIFDGLSSGQNAITFWEPTYGGGSNSYGDGAFSSSTSLGSNTFVFAEDNVFNNILTANDCVQGGKYVFRFNTLNNTAVQTHPTGSQGRGRGCRAFETYENTFSASNSSPIFNAYFLSSGAGVVWGNSALTGYESFISLHSMLRDNSTYSQTATPNGWGYCGTSFDGTGSAWDGNTSTSTGYPCLDQPGRGKSDLLSGAFPNAVDTVTNTVAWPHQQLEPIYEWLDNWEPVPGYPYPLVNNYNPEVLIQNQDYYTYNSSFNGTAGTGSGVLSARPSTCTVGVAYWATDQGNWNQSGSGGQGELFVCTATNTWTLYYTPYTYPHPLTTGQASQSQPAAPVNLVAVPH
jgi:hypothetical protein